MDPTLALWCERWLPLAFGVLFIGGLFGYRAWRFSRVHGFSPVHVPHAGDHSARAFLSRVLVVCFAIVLALGALTAFWPDGLAAIDLLYERRRPALIEVGAVLALLAAWIVWRGQEDMAGSWRIGIVAGEHTDLVTRGLFRFCRNPIYLGLQVGLAGFCCLLPGYLPVGLLIVGALLMQVQARLEEDHLFRQHGTAYAEYCARVGRFLPFTGRWPAPVGRERDGQPD